MSSHEHTYAYFSAKVEKRTNLLAVKVNRGRSANLSTMVHSTHTAGTLALARGAATAGRTQDKSPRTVKRGRKF